MTIPPLDLASTIPAFLGHLGISCSAAEPPPSIFPLLEPILRERIKLFTSGASRSSTASATETASWVQYLCWQSPVSGIELCGIVNNMIFDDANTCAQAFGDSSRFRAAAYRKVDDETLKARACLRPEYDLTFVFQWCAADDQGTEGWRIAEVLPGDRSEIDYEQWSCGVEDAEIRAADDKVASRVEDRGNGADDHNVDDGDDDYWAQYDTALGDEAEDPEGHQENTSAPPAASNAKSGGRRTSTSSSSYFDSYANVQPALDPSDPFIENSRAAGVHTLKGDDILSSLARELLDNNNAEQKGTQAGTLSSDTAPTITPASNSGNVDDRSSLHQEDVGSQYLKDVDAPLSHHPAVQRKEERGTEETNVAVRTHISNTIQSLRRLASGSGIPTEDFKSIVTEELQRMS